MGFETILYEVEGSTALVRLNRPERMNAVTERMYTDLGAALDRAGADPAVRALVLTGTVLRRPDGEKQAFCAGADLKQHATGERTAAERRDYILLAHETTRRLATFEKPVIAAVNGPARGAGAELLLCCDFVLMAERATVAFPETGLGTFVGGGATRHLAEIVGAVQARRLVYTGDVLDGAGAVAIGLALSCHPEDALLPAARALADRLATRAPLSLAYAKRLIREAPRRSLEEVLAAESEAILALMETEDWKEGVAAFAERREPRFRGC